MATIKCKMCTAPLEVTEGMTVVQCNYCQSVQTVPVHKDDSVIPLFDRANYYRTISEFDRAASIYDTIISRQPYDSEAHWGACLCRYGIEYVQDPRTGKRVPTCHRAQFASILDDKDYLQALKYADSKAKTVYQEEAAYIDSVQKKILAISTQEKPFDIFICYKETDAQGERTMDSVLAQEIYDALTNKGYNVFFSRITLEDKLGTAYEPYIFAALNSAGIMLAVGTRPEYYNAVWVKNEWSRYLALIQAGQKKTLIPCYKNMTPYDMPDEFAMLQAQDMGKLGWMQDLVRGIEKILPLNKTVAVAAPPPQADPREIRYTQAVKDMRFTDTEAKLNRLEKIFESLKGYKDSDSLARQCRDKIRQLNRSAMSRSQKSAKAAQLFSARDTEIFAVAPNGVRLGTNDSLRSSPRSKMSMLSGVSSGYFHVLGLRADGRVVASGKNSEGEGEVSSWRDIVAVSAGKEFSLGLRSDGTVVAAGLNGDNACEVSGWTDVVALAAGSFHSMGLRSDGTVYSTDPNNSLNVGQCNVQDWSGMTGIAAGHLFSAGLRNDGTVVAIGDNSQGQCNVEKWTDIIAITAGYYHLVGLKSDGTVVAVGQNNCHQCEVERWTDIIAIQASDENTVGLRSDGTLISTKSFITGHENWRLFNDLDKLDEQRLAAIKKYRAAKEAELAGLQQELRNLKGLFVGKKKAALQEQIYAIELELE